MTRWLSVTLAVLSLSAAVFMLGTIGSVFWTTGYYDHPSSLAFASLAIQLLFAVTSWALHVWFGTEPRWTAVPWLALALSLFAVVGSDIFILRHPFRAVAGWSALWVCGCLSLANLGAWTGRPGQSIGWRSTVSAIRTVVQRPAATLGAVALATLVPWALQFLPVVFLLISSEVKAHAVAVSSPLPMWLLGSSMLLGVFAVVLCGLFLLLNPAKLAWAQVYRSQAEVAPAKPRIASPRGWRWSCGTYFSFFSWAG
jgi:hypothetical protein